MILFVVYLVVLQDSPASLSDSFPPAMVSFLPAEPMVLFKGAGPGNWDAQIRERGWILRDEKGYHLWFTGYVDKKIGPMFLGYATSPDGLLWTRHPANPIFRDAWVEDVQVIRDGEDFYMFAEGKGDQAQLLTSRDGITWERVGTLDIRLTNGKPIPKGPFGTPTAHREKGLWHLFYERLDRGVWHATSDDTKIWTNVSDEPVLRPGPGEYDASAIAVNQIVPYQGRYYAFYHGLGKEGPGRWCTCVAVSEDLREWRKYERNPLTSPADNQSSGILVRNDVGYQLYTMHPDVRLHRSASTGSSKR
jgi:beta-1,2-mannobiose phosphorylase / 1,2-beta-oligomannan phosphorylase